MIDEQAWLDAWNSGHAGPNAVLVRGRLYVSDECGGEEEEQRLAMVCHLRDGRATWIGTFFSAADARRAYEAGVTGPVPG